MYINGVADYTVMKETSIFKAGIQKVLQVATQKIKVTLMRSESDHNDCHRKHLIADVLHKAGAHNQNRKVFTARCNHTNFHCQLFRPV